MKHRAQLSVRKLESRAMPALFAVMNTSDSGLGSLRQAVLDANALFGVDTIAFAESMAGGIVTLAGAEILVTGAVTIIGPTLLGPGIPNITIDGLGTSRIFNISTATATVENYALLGVKLARGNASNSGGAVFFGTPEDNFTFSDCVFDGNKAANYGGAIGSAEPANTTTYGTVNITRCKFTNNSNAPNYWGSHRL